MIILKLRRFKLTKFTKKVVQNHWYLLHWIHHDYKNWWSWKYSQCKSVVVIFNHASGYIKEKKGNKHLIFDDSVNENKALLKSTQMFGMELKTKSKQ